MKTASGAREFRPMRMLTAAVLVGGLASGCGLKGAGSSPEPLQVAAPEPETSSQVETPAASPKPPLPTPSPPASPVPTPSRSVNAETSPAAPEGPRSALALVGRWHVEGPGVANGTALVIGEELALFLSCGVIDGGWEADGRQGLFVASTYGGDSNCFSPNKSDPWPSWLKRSRGFDVDQEQRTLLDVDGHVVARLRPGARPTVGPNRISDSVAEPEVSPRLRARLADPAPLPQEATPVTPQQLQRRWASSTVSNPRVEVSFTADGGYSGSDGCNGVGGGYALGREGRLVTTGGASTSIGCDGAPVGYWVATAARAGLVGADLVLYDQDGKVLGRLRTA